MAIFYYSKYVFFIQYRTQELAINFVYPVFDGYPDPLSGGDCS